LVAADGNVSSGVVVAQMTNGDEVCADAASMVLLSDGVALEPATNRGTTAESLLQALDSPVPLTHYRCMAPLGVVTFAANACGEVRQLDIRGTTWFCARDAFLFCSRDVHTTIGQVHKFSAESRQEANATLYRLSGRGDAFIHCGGNAIEYDLVPGQRVSVEIGCVAAYQDTVQSTIEFVEGLSGADGAARSIYLMTLTGPGKIYLATLPPSRIALAQRITN